MLQKKQRLTSVEIEEVMIKGKPLFSDFFILKFIKNHTPSAFQGLKISAVSPKKAFPTAVLRNKARRRIYSALTSFLKTQKPKSNILIAIIGNKKVLNTPFSDLGASLEQTFRKGGIL